MGNVRGREQFGRESHEGDHSGKIIFFFFLICLWAFLVVQTIKNLPVMQDTGVQSLGRELLIHLFGCTGSLVVALVIFAVSGGISPCGTWSL